MILNLIATILAMACVTAIAVAGDRWQFWALYAVAAFFGIWYFVSIADVPQSALWGYFLAMDVVNVYRTRHVRVQRCKRCNAILKKTRVKYYCPACGEYHGEMHS